MLKGSDVGLIVGSELAAKGTELLGKWTEATYGLSAAPLHLKVTTYLPVVGAVLVIAGAQAKYFKKEKSKEAQLAAVVYGSRLLASGVDVVQAAATPGVVFGLVQVPAIPAPGDGRGLPTAGYLPALTGGIGRPRDLF